MKMTAVPEPLEVADQIEHLALHGHVEGGGGFVGDQESGFVIKAMAIITRWRMPPENSCG
jgi:hypothetical protein